MRAVGYTRLIPISKSRSNFVPVNTTNLAPQLVAVAQRSIYKL